MPSSDNSVAFYTIVCSNWPYEARQKLGAIAAQMDGPVFVDDVRLYDHEQDDWEYPLPPVWGGETPYYLDDDEAVL